MVTIVLGRKGVIRGRKPVQIKVRPLIPFLRICNLQPLVRS